MRRLKSSSLHGGDTATYPRATRPFRVCTESPATFSPTVLVLSVDVTGSQRRQLPTMTRLCRVLSPRSSGTRNMLRFSELSLGSPKGTRRSSDSSSGRVLTREQVAEMFFVSRAAIDTRIARAYKKMAKTLNVSQQDLFTTPATVEEGGEA
jgi:hypothetical protein